MKLGKIIGLGAVALVLAAGVWAFLTYQGVMNEGLRQEKQIVSLNNSNTIELNQYVASLKEQVGIANVKSAALDKVLKDALSARYNPTQMADPNAKGSFYSAMHEAYPNIDLSLYDKILDFVKAKREGYAVLQKQMQKLLEEFDVWRGSFPNSIFTGNLPDHWLKVQDNDGNMLEGQKALDYLNTISQPNGSNNGGGQNAVTIPGLEGK
ncbi:MAG: hypothetical protein U0103_24560 [Candidatus Obscuribacterales bacterium]|nr:MAG: hypothetical protein EKK48_08940 [Candidatus Melainabacteria bacterium]